MPLACRPGRDYQADPSPEQNVRRWAHEGECSEAGDAALAHLREENDGNRPPSMFSVGFVSVLAGTMLAAQLIKEHMPHDGPLDEQEQSAKFQLMNRTVTRNGRAQTVQRDPRCPACQPDTVAVNIWRERTTTWQPPQPGA
jgi:hypothetical protein